MNANAKKSLISLVLISLSIGGCVCDELELPAEDFGPGFFQTPVIVWPDGADALACVDDEAVQLTIHAYGEDPSGIDDLFTQIAGAELPTGTGCVALHAEPGQRIYTGFFRLGDLTDRSPGRIAIRPCDFEIAEDQGIIPE